MGKMMPGHIKIEIQGFVGIVTLNRPERHNALSLKMWQHLPEVMLELDEKPTIHTIFLTGAGNTFSAGADISEFSTVRATVEQAVDYEIAVDACGDAIENLRKPTVAVINGFCLGGACHIAMACDFRFADQDSSFSIPAARLSIVYGASATRKLISLVGLSKAKLILYTAQRFSARDGLSMGFFDEISTDPMETAHKLAAQIADLAPLSLVGAKLLLNGMAKGFQDTDLTLAENAIDNAVRSNDYLEGCTAFTEKRKPKFTGT